MHVFTLTLQSGTRYNVLVHVRYYNTYHQFLMILKLVEVKLPCETQNASQHVYSRTIKIFEYLNDKNFNKMTL